MQVNLKLFTPAPNKRRTVLLFVFRDRTRTPLARLIETWEEDLRQMWASITKPPDYEGCDITDFFEVCRDFIHAPEDQLHAYPDQSYATRAIPLQCHTPE